MQVFERCGFQYGHDELIVLGDVCDGWPETKKCIDELLKIENLIYLIGNHDDWSLQWMTQPRDVYWKTQGGQETFNSYIPESHIEFLKNAHLWHVDEETNQLFVHGGIDTDKQIESQEKDTCLWDRDLLYKARMTHQIAKKPEHKYSEFDEIFIGHTTTLAFDTMKPVHFCNVWGLDTGGGWGGKLTIMDRITKEYWQSDVVKTLYPGIQGRG